jgi:hypothetical protein
MIRKRKDRVSYDEMLEQVMESLYIDEVPQVSCMLKNRKTSPIYCTSKCSKPCTNFTLFRFVTLKCESDTCDPLTPCLPCLDEIEDMKTLIAVMHMLKPKRAFSTKRRIVSWNAWCNKMKKRLGNG